MTKKNSKNKKINYQDRDSGTFMTGKYILGSFFRSLTSEVNRMVKNLSITDSEISESEISESEADKLNDELVELELTYLQTYFGTEKNEKSIERPETHNLSVYPSKRFADQMLRLDYLNTRKQVRFVEIVLKYLNSLF